MDLKYLLSHPEDFETAVKQARNTSFLQFAKTGYDSNNKHNNGFNSSYEDPKLHLIIEYSWYWHKYNLAGSQKVFLLEDDTAEIWRMDISGKIINELPAANYKPDLVDQMITEAILSSHLNMPLALRGPIIYKGKDFTYTTVTSTKDPFTVSIEERIKITSPLKTPRIIYEASCKGSLVTQQNHIESIKAAGI